MRKLTVALMVLSLVLTGVAIAAAADLPQALQGVDLKAAQQVNNSQAQTVRGAAQGVSSNPTPGTCISTTTVCVPNLYLAPGPHKK
jgi:hypothetical protein